MASHLDLPYSWASYLPYTWLPRDVNSLVPNNGSRVGFLHVPAWTQQKEIRTNRQGSLRLYCALAWDIKELCLFSLTCLTPIVSLEEIRMWWKAYKECFESKIVYIAKAFGARLSGSCHNYSTWDAEAVYRLPRQTQLHGHTYLVSKTKYLNLSIYIFIFVCACVCLWSPACHVAHTEVTGQPWGAGSLLLPCISQELNSGHLAWK